MSVFFRREDLPVNFLWKFVLVSELVRKLNVSHFWSSQTNKNWQRAQTWT